MAFVPFQNSLFKCVQKEPVQYRIADNSLVSQSPHDNKDGRKGVAHVELEKKEGIVLGLTVSGGTDKGTRPQISNLRPGGIAYRSDALQVGDYIQSVNGIRTSNLKHEEIVNLLKNAGDKVILEIEYFLPESGVDLQLVQPSQHEVQLEKEGNSFGFTIRGGFMVDTMMPNFHVVTHVRPGGPADREKSIQVGDRIVAVNHYSISHLNLTETLGVLSQCEQTTSFTVEYDVSIMEAVQNASGPLLVEIEKSPGTDLGLILTESFYKGKRVIAVDSVIPMSTADRSGALHVGDHLLAIDDANVSEMSVPEATQLLRTGNHDPLQLEVLPVSHIQNKMAREALLPGKMVSSASSPLISASSSMHNGFSTLPAYGTMNSIVSASLGFSTLRSSNRRRTLPRPERKPSYLSIASSVTSSVVTAGHQICRTESVDVTLNTDHRGLGICLDGGSFPLGSMQEPPVIGAIEPKSVVEKSSVIHEGDRLISINGVATYDKSFDEVSQMVRDCRNGRHCLQIEFDVAESVLPSSGTYIVKLPKKPGACGFTINAPMGRKMSDPLTIGHVEKGSLAYRLGSVRSGDRLISINDMKTENLSVEDATNILKFTEDIIKLKLNRREIHEDDIQEECITYTVELQRRGGPLGVTISGTEDPLDPIVISELTDGGLAERTGAIHVGDRLLAVNGNLMLGKPLSEAISMLQSAGDIVTMKIARPADGRKQSFACHSYERDETKSTTPITSNDSAMESWDSSEMNHGNSLNRQKPMLVAVPQFKEKPSRICTQACSDSLDAEGSREMLAERPLSVDGWDDQSNSSSSQESNEELNSWKKTIDDLDQNGHSDLLKQIGKSLRQKSTQSLDRHVMADIKPKPPPIMPKPKIHRPADSFKASQKAGSHRSVNSDNLVSVSQILHDRLGAPTPVQLHKVKLVKDSVDDDFGLSLSDGMYERGVYISAIRPNGLADNACLKPFDRILQINGVKTRDYDCCLAVPLIADAEHSLELIISRNPLVRHQSQPKDLDLYGEDSGLTHYINDTLPSSNNSCKTV